jgi:hypothetical protein
MKKGKGFVVVVVVVVVRIVPVNVSLIPLIICLF